MTVLNYNLQLTKYVWSRKHFFSLIFNTCQFNTHLIAITLAVIKKKENEKSKNELVSLFIIANSTYTKLSSL